MGWSRALRSRGVQLSLVVVLLGGALLAGVASEDRAKAIGASGAIGTASLVGAQALLAVSPFPSQLIAIPLAALNGFWLGAFLLWCAWMLAALLQYSLARLTADDIELDAWLERAPLWLRRFPVGHPAFLILTRQLPIGPHIVNICPGAIREAGSPPSRSVSELTMSGRVEVSVASMVVPGRVIRSGLVRRERRTAGDVEVHQFPGATQAKALSRLPVNPHGDADIHEHPPGRFVHRQDAPGHDTRRPDDGLDEPASAARGMYAQRRHPDRPPDALARLDFDLGDLSG